MPLSWGLKSLLRLLAALGLQLQQQHCRRLSPLEPEITWGGLPSPRPPSPRVNWGGAEYRCRYRAIGSAHVGRRLRLLLVPESKMVPASTPSQYGRAACVCTTPRGSSMGWFLAALSGGRGRRSQSEQAFESKLGDLLVALRTHSSAGTARPSLRPSSRKGMRFA